MITGTVGRSRRPVIVVELIDRDGQPRSAEAYVDTGFSGDLTLPRTAIEMLGLSPNNRVNMQIGDGAFATFTTYRAAILWDGAPKDVTVVESEIWSVAGVGLLWQCNLSIDFAPGGNVLIASL